MKWLWWFAMALPVVADDRVFVFGGTGKVRTLDAATGQVQWHPKRLWPNATAVPLVVAAGKRQLALAVGDGLAIAIDLATGTERGETPDVTQ